jgi:hypothetical protein
MCCGRKSGRSRKGKSGKITRSKKPIQPPKIDKNEQQHSEDRERLQLFPDGQREDQTRTVGPSEISGQELLP